MEDQKMTHKISISDGLIEIKHSTTGAILSSVLKFGSVKDADNGKNLTVYYIDFVKKGSNKSSMSDDDWNSMKLTAIASFNRMIYNRFLFRSSDSNPNKLYKSVFNVKGKSMTLVPKFELL